MFHFHAGVVGDVNIITPGLLLGEVVLDAHIHIERLIGLCLAVLHALDLVIGSGSGELELDTVLLAVLEEQLRERMLLQRRLAVVRVLGPVASRRHYN